MFDEDYKATFGSRTVVFCPLTVKHIRTMPDEITALTTVVKGQDPFSPERFTKLLKLYTASARRADSAITEDDVENIVDFRNIYILNKVLLGQDWKKSIDSKDGSAAKDIAQTPTSPQIGGESTTAS